MHAFQTHEYRSERLFKLIFMLKNRLHDATAFAACFAAASLGFSSVFADLQGARSSHAFSETGGL